MSILAGDVVLMKDDLYSEARYYVKKTKAGKAKIMTISPAEIVFECDLDELEKVNMTLDEARQAWSKQHGYSGVWDRN